MNVKKNKLFKIVLISVLSIIVIAVVCIATFLLMLFEPAYNKGEYFEPVTNEVYGNTSANLNNGGKVCEYGDDVLISTSNGIKKFSPNTYAIEGFISENGSYINVVGDNIYYLNDYKIYKYRSGNIELVSKSKRYFNESMQVVGEYAFTFSDGITPRLNYINLVDNNSYRIKGTSFPRDGEYYNGELIYHEGANSHYENDAISKLLNNGEQIRLFDILESITYFIHDNAIYYAFYNSDRFIEKRGLWRYDLNTDSNDKLMDSDNDIHIKNIINNKILYTYKSPKNLEYWYSFDIITKEITSYKEDDCEVFSIYVANSLIFTQVKKGDDVFYRVYDSDFNYLNIEIN